MIHRYVMLGVFLPVLSVGGGGACSVSTFVCSSDDECGPTGVCEPVSVCSFPDSSCSSGRRYGRYSGSYAAECTALDAVDTDAEPPPAMAEGGVSPDLLPSTGEPGGLADGTSTGSTTVAGGDAGAPGSSTTADGDGDGDGDADGDAEPDTTTTTDMTPESCDDRYGAVPGYLLCEQVGEECRFYAQTNGSCDALCSGSGGDCLAAFRDMGNSCMIIEEIDCSTTRADQICVCTL
ncbi:MAG: hypothetical protein AAGF11_01145 [Myxococcota bacterium]